MIFLTQNIKFRILKDKDGELLYDIRTYYHGKPTKKGIRLKSDALDILKYFSN